MLVCFVLNVSHIQSSKNRLIHRKESWIGTVREAHANNLLDLQLKFFSLIAAWKWKFIDKMIAEQLSQIECSQCQAQQTKHRITERREKERRKERYFIWERSNEQLIISSKCGLIELEPQEVLNVMAIIKCSYAMRSQWWHQWIRNGITSIVDHQLDAIHELFCQHRPKTPKLFTDKNYDLKIISCCDFGGSICCGVYFLLSIFRRCLTS